MQLYLIYLNLFAVQKLAAIPDNYLKVKKSFKQSLLGYQWDLKSTNRGIMCYESVPALGIAPAHTCQVEKESQVAVECAALRSGEGGGGSFP